jgi:hypothetical protein
LSPIDRPRISNLGIRPWMPNYRKASVPTGYVQQWISTRP